MKLEDLGLSPAPWNVSNAGRSRTVGARRPLMKVRDSGLITICEIRQRDGRREGTRHDAANFRAIAKLPELLEYWCLCQRERKEDASKRRLSKEYLNIELAAYFEQHPLIR